jgi:pimeloyl-ACP methyl ester carboxylesterase
MLSSFDYKSYYYPKIKTPTMHVIGRFDPMIGESQTLGLARRCSKGRILYHPGSHFAPMNKFFVKAVTEFIDGIICGRQGEDDDSDWVDI